MLRKEIMKRSHLVNAFSLQMTKFKQSTHITHKWRWRKRYCDFVRKIKLTWLFKREERRAEPHGCRHLPLDAGRVWRWGAGHTENETHTHREIGTRVRESEVKANMGKERLVRWEGRTLLVQTDHIKGNMRSVKAAGEKSTEFQ